MAKKATEHTSAKQTSQKGNAPMDGLKKAVSRASDLASLKMKLHTAESRRKDAYTRLGKLAYTKWRPRKGNVPEDVERNIEETMQTIGELSDTITDLSLRLEIMKCAGAGK